MRVPEHILSRVRGPILAAALAGCGGPADPVSIEPDLVLPAPVPPPAVAVVEPVDYDPTAETARLEALDVSGASALGRRERRIENAERIARRGGHGVNSSSPPWADPNWNSIMAACGRG